MAAATRLRNKDQGWPRLLRPTLGKMDASNQPRSGLRSKLEQTAMCVLPQGALGDVFAHRRGAATKQMVLRG